MKIIQITIDPELLHKIDNDEESMKKGSIWNSSMPLLPATRNPQPATRNSQPATRNS